MVTPSTPAHDTDYEIFYFTPEQQKQRGGFVSNVTELFASFTPIREHRIALPDSPSPDAFSGSGSAYGQMASSSSSRQKWSAAKKFRAFLIVFSAVFVALHLILIPHATGGVFDIFHHEQHKSDSTYGSALLWQGWEEVPVDGSEPGTVAAPALAVGASPFAPTAVEDAVPTAVAPAVPSSRPSPNSTP